MYSKGGKGKDLCARVLQYLEQNKKEKNQESFDVYTRFSSDLLFSTLNCVELYFFVPLLFSRYNETDVAFTSNSNINHSPRQMSRFECSFYLFIMKKKTGSLFGFVCFFYRTLAEGQRSILS